MSRRSPLLLLVVVGLAVAAALSGRPGGAGDDRAAAPDARRQPSAPVDDRVVRVVDGDTVVLRATGRSRLIGVDTPEVHGRRECFGAEASAFAKRTLPAGTAVVVERDAEPRDRYGRSLIYLTLPDGRSYNELLVAEGFAVTLTIAPNVRHAERLRELERRARAAQAGLWSPTACGARAAVAPAASGATATARPPAIGVVAPRRLGR